MTWIPNSDVVSGLPDIGVTARPVVFYDSGVWKIIAVSGDMPANVYGFYWDGSTWINDSSIVTGLSGEWLYGNGNCAIFNDSGTWKLVWVEQLVTTQFPRFKGYYWNGSSWVANSGIVSGLYNSGYDNIVVSAFDDNGTLRLLYGIHVGWVIQFVWGGSSWSQESSVMVFGDRSACAFVDDGVVKAVTVGAKGYYKSSGTTWVEDSSISDGLTSGHHAIFKDGDAWKAVVGNANGTFSGYVLGEPPVADAGGPYTGKAKRAVSFDGSGSTDPDGTIVSWEWDFGDSETDTGETVEHSYAVENTYTVVLTVTDNDGLTDTDSTTATISPAEATKSGHPHRRSTGASVSGGMECGMGKRRK